MVATDHDGGPSGAVSIELTLEQRLAMLVSPDRRLDLAVERVLNTSSIHDDHLDRAPMDAMSLTSDPGAVERLMVSNFCRVPKGWVFTSMTLDRISGLWTVAATNADGGEEKASHALQAVAKCMVAVRLARA